MKKLMKISAVALGVFGVVGVALAEGGAGSDAAAIVDTLATDVGTVITALVALVSGVVAAASVIWLSILAYKRGRSAAKSAAS